MLTYLDHPWINVQEYADTRKEGDFTSELSEQGEGICCARLRKIS